MGVRRGCSVASIEGTTGELNAGKQTITVFCVAVAVTERSLGLQPLAWRGGGVGGRGRAGYEKGAVCRTRGQPLVSVISRLWVY